MSSPGTVSRVRSETGARQWCAYRRELIALHVVGKNISEELNYSEENSCSLAWGFV